MNICHNFTKLCKESSMFLDFLIQIQNVKVRKYVSQPQLHVKYPIEDEKEKLANAQNIKGSNFKLSNYIVIKYQII